MNKKVSKKTRKTRNTRNVYKKGVSGQVCMFTEEEIIEKYNNVIDKFMKNKGLTTYTQLLEEEGLPSSTATDYKKRYESVDRLGKILTDMWTSRLTRKGLEGTVNAGFAQFILKCKAGYISESDRRRADNDSKELDMQERTINIGFNKDE